MNLNFYAKTTADYDKVQSIIKASERYAEYNREFESASFPIDSQEEADKLEPILQELFYQNDIVNGHFESED